MKNKNIYGIIIIDILLIIGFISFRNQAESILDKEDHIIETCEEIGKSLDEFGEGLNELDSSLDAIIKQQDTINLLIIEKYK